VKWRGGETQWSRDFVEYEKPANAGSTEIGKRKQRMREREKEKERKNPSFQAD